MMKEAAGAATIRELLGAGAVGVRAWREQNPTTIADLRGCDLADLDLAGLHLAAVDARAATLRRVSLAGAVLDGAQLQSACFEQCDLVRCDLNHASLQGATLRGCDLRKADLHGADLSAANLDGANLADADLKGAILDGASLVGANLDGACLGLASLDQCNLHRASLRRTDLSNASLQGAVLELAHFGRTIVATDLTNAEGLHLSRHTAPSFLSHELLVRPTARPWPREFLHGCGLTPKEIEHLSQLVAGVSFHTCFISYSTKDDEFASQLHAALQERGVPCWLDKHDVLPGEDLHRRIADAIRRSDKVLLCCTKDSLQSWWVEDELTRALDKERRNHRPGTAGESTIVPLDLDGFLFTSGCKHSLAEVLRARHAAPFCGWREDPKVFEQQLERVLRAVQIRHDRPV